MSDRHTFKDHVISSSERRWLDEASKPRFDARQAKVRLRGELPRDFFPEQLSERLYSGNEITPLGRWYLNPHDPLLSGMDQVIRAIKRRIEQDKNPRIITAADIASETGLTTDAAGRAFYAMSLLGHFFHTAKGPAVHGMAHAYDQIELTDQSSFDNYLYYEGLEDLLERFYRGGRGRALYGPHAALAPSAPKQATAPGSATDDAAKTRVDRILDRLRNHPVVAVAIVIGIIVIGLSQFVDALKALNPFTTSKAETSSTPSPAQAASASAEARRDACVDRLVSEFKATQPFAQNGGVSCAGAGPSTRGERNSAIVTYTAPPGFQIVGAAHVQERSNIDGGYGDIAYHEENGLVSQLSTPIHCKSENKMFGAGGSEQITLVGQIERIVQPEDTERFNTQCAAAETPSH